MHLPQLIQDLAIILAVAGIMNLLFKSIGQPVVLGYIIAGFLVGPHFEWLPNVVEVENIKVWAEMGVIFLLFGLGLEFSFKKLASVGTSSSITTFIEITGMMGVGFLVGQLFGWGRIDSLYLGGILAISSTTIIVRALEELQMKTRGFVGLVFGVLIVEDLVAILLMVILSTVAVSQSFSGAEMGYAVLKLIFFLVLWFVLGIVIIPTVLKKTRHLLQEEALLVLSLSACFLMVVIAAKVGFSPALGAFIVGSLFAETLEGERIEKVTSSIRTFFGAIFFVSVGMLVDPRILLEYFWPICIITLVTIVGKIATTTFGALVAGQGLRRSVQAGLSLAQIGEFSFIIASLGVTLKVTSDFLYPIAISVSAITTFTTPYFIKYSDSIVDWVERVLPDQLLQRLAGFQTATLTIGQTRGWKEHVKGVSIRVLVNSVIIIAVFMLVSQTAIPWIESEMIVGMPAKLIGLACAVMLSAPFFWALVSVKLDLGEQLPSSAQRYLSPYFILTLVSWFYAVGLLAVLASFILPPSVSLATMLAFAIVAGYLMPANIAKVYNWIESRFVENLESKNGVHKDLPALAPWDSHIVELKVQADSPLVGKKLEEAKIRERFGVTIVLIERGSKRLTAPAGNVALFPEDLLLVVGTDEQISHFKTEVEPLVGPQALELPSRYELAPLIVKSHMSYANKSIRDSGLREALNGLVVGVEKSGKRILNPDSSLVIEANDVLWVVGDSQLLAKLSD